jgi:hypothetical protein
MRLREVSVCQSINTYHIVTLGMGAWASREGWELLDVPSCDFGKNARFE